jgi:hypothetical protein
VRALVVRSRVVGLAVVCIVMRLRVEGVVAVVAHTARSRIVIIVVGASSVGNVLYRILGDVSHSPALRVFVGTTPGSELCAAMSLLNAQHVHLAGAVTCRPKLLLGWVPWGSREALATHSGGRPAGTRAVAARARVCGPQVVEGPFRSRRYRRGDL